MGSKPLTWTRALAFNDRGALPYRAGPLTPQQWREWWEDGWTVIKAPDAVDYAGIQGILGGLLEENARRLVQSGTLAEGAAPLTAGRWEALLRRQGAIEVAVPGNTAGGFSGAARSKLLFSDAMKRAVSHPSMLGIVRQLTGAEDICLTGNYALRAKAPSEPMLAQGKPDGGTVPWHQDTCVIPPDVS